MSEDSAEKEYKVFPFSGLVIGFQYKGQLSVVKNETTSNLSSAGITGISVAIKYLKTQ